MSWLGWLYFGIGLISVAFRAGYRRTRGLPPDGLREMLLQMMLWLPLWVWSLAEVVSEGIGKRKGTD